MGDIFRTALLKKVKKAECTTDELKQLALETIHTLYPDSEWLHLYTDGSLYDTETSAGAGIHCKLFDLYLSAGTNSTNFDGEVLAIHMALSQLLCRIKLFCKVVIFSDSLAIALHSVLK